MGGGLGCLVLPKIHSLPQVNGEVAVQGNIARHALNDVLFIFNF